MDIILITTAVFTVIGMVVGAGLVFTGKKFAVKVDEREVAVRELLPGWGELYFHQLSPAALSLIRGVMQANEDVHLHAFDDGSEKYRSNEPMQRLLRRSFIRYFGREEAAEMITALRETRLSSMKNVRSGSTPRFDLIQTFSNWNENGIAYAPVFNDRDYPLFEMLKVADTNKLEAARCFQLVRMISSWL